LGSTHSEKRDSKAELGPSHVGKKGRREKQPKLKKTGREYLKLRRRISKDEVKSGSSAPRIECVDCHCCSAPEIAGMKVATGETPNASTLGGRRSD